MPARRQPPRPSPPSALQAATLWMSLRVEVPLCSSPSPPPKRHSGAGSLCRGRPRRGQAESHDGRRRYKGATPANVILSHRKEEPRALRVSRARRRSSGLSDSAPTFPEGDASALCGTREGGSPGTAALGAAGAGEEGVGGQHNGAAARSFPSLSKTRLPLLPPPPPPLPLLRRSGQAGPLLC